MMRNRINNVFFYLIPAFLIFSAMDLRAAQDPETAKMAIHSNQAMIRKFQKEYDDLLEMQKNNELPEIAKNRLNELKNKIDVLVHQNEMLMAVLPTPIPTEPVPDPDLSELDEEYQREPRGKDWILMTPKDKEMYIYSAIGALELQEVFIMKPAGFYVEALDKMMILDPSWKDRKLDNFFVYNVYENEPQARNALRTIASRYTKNTQ